MTSQIISQNRQAIDKIAEENDISYLALFGSYSRGEQKKNSDLDLLVTFDKTKGLFELVDVQDKLSQVLGVKVDLVTKNGLSRYIKPYIQDDLQIIYEKKS